MGSARRDIASGLYGRFVTKSGQIKFAYSKSQASKYRKKFKEITWRY